MAILFLLALIALVVLYVKLRKAESAAREAQAHMANAAAGVQQMSMNHAAELERRAQRAVAASRGSLDGHIAQQAFPVAPHHSYHPKDIFHMGGVMDYVVFDGLYDVRHNGRDPRTVTVVFADVKWGTSRLSDAQKAVMAAANEGRVRAEEWHARGESDGSLAFQRRELR